MSTAYDMCSSNRRRVCFLFTAFSVLLLLAVYWVAYGYGLHYYAYENLNGEKSYISRVTDAAFEYVASAAVSGSSSVSFETPDMDGLKKTSRAFAWRAVALVFLLALAWFKMSGRLSASMALNAAHAVRLDDAQHRELYRLAGTACLAAGIKPVRLYVISDRGLNAFSVGTSESTAGIVLTQGLLDGLTHQELEAVLAHEAAHLRNGDVNLMMAGLSSALLFSFLSEALFIVALNPKRGGIFGTLAGVLLGAVCAVIGWVALPLMRLALSRSAELNADAQAVLLCRNPQALISALEKISKNSYVSVLANHPTMAAMCIAAPQEKNSLVLSLTGFFSTHPPVEKRIAALREMDGGY